jgi:hypothetical protein
VSAELLHRLDLMLVEPCPLPEHHRLTIRQAYSALAAQPALVRVLTAILNAHESDNNGAYMGEAVLCRQFAMQARDALDKVKP